jgi:hypothetical protein
MGLFQKVPKMLLLPAAPPGRLPPLNHAKLEVLGFQGVIVLFADPVGGWADTQSVHKIPVVISSFVFIAVYV